MAEAERLNTNYDCFLIVVPSIRTQEGGGVKFDIQTTKQVYEILKSDWKHLKGHFESALKKECNIKLIDFDLNHEEDYHMFCKCQFASSDDHNRFYTFVDVGKMAAMFTKYAEDTAIALQMGYEISTNFKVSFSVSNAMSTAKIRQENEKSQTSSHIATKDENIEKLQRSEIKNKNSDMTKIGHTPTVEDKNKSKILIRLYVHTEERHVKNVSLHLNGDVSHMNNLNHTKLWETYVFVSTSEKKIEFSIEENYRTYDSLSVPEHPPINRQQVFSVNASVSYVFLLMPKESSHIPIYNKAMLENLRYIVTTVAERNINESVLQLEAVMRECVLSENVGLHVKCKNWALEDAKFILQELATNDNNAVLYCYLVYLIITDLSVLCTGKIVDFKSAQTILNACPRISRRNFPIHCIKSAACVMQYLCKLVYKDEASILLLLHISYNLFGDEVFLKTVESNLKDGNKVLELYKPTSQFECSDLLEGLYNSALVDKHSCQLVQLIFRHLHINQLLDFMQKIKKNNLHGGLFNSIVEKLSYEIMRVMTSSGKKGDLKEVLQFWKKAYALGVNCPKVIFDYTQNAIVTALAFEDKMVRFTDVDLLYGVLKEDNLFKSSESQFQLLTLLSRSKNTDLQQMFFDLLNQTKHLNLNEDQMWQIIYPCFVNTLLVFKNKQGYGKDKILKYYFHYNRIIGTSYVQKHCNIQQKLEAVILGEMQKCKLRHMILAIPDIEAARWSADIFQKHINTIMLQCCTMDSLNTITNDICGSLPLMVDTRTMLSVIQTILNTVEIANEEPDETIFEKITDSSKFWICILTSKGKMVDEIKQHTRVKTIETTIRNTIHAINKQCINSKFLLLLMNRVEESKSILHCIADETGNLNDKLSKCQKEISYYQQNLILVDNTLKQLKRISNKRLQSILRKSIELVKECDDDLSQGKIIADELLAGTCSTQIVQDIAELCKHLENVVSTCVFRNLTQQFLENKEAEFKQFKDCTGHDVYNVSLSFLFNEPKADGNDLNRFSLKSTKKVIEVIAKDCVGQYKEWWNNFDLGIDHTLTDLGTILMGVEDMVTEIRKAENTCIFTFEEHIRKGLIQFSKLSSYTQTVDSIKIAAKAFKFDNQNSIYFDTVHQFEILINENLSNVTLKEVIPLLQKIDRVDKIISEDIQNILQAIKKSSALLDFLQEVVDDDLRNLIDAVEEHSEQYVRESTVSDLIEIKRFLHPILKGSFLEKMNEFFELLQKQIDNTGNNSISGKILICGDNLHSLKALYRNVANRGERTVEVIENIMQKGTFHFSLKSTRICEVAVQYAQDEKEYTHSSADLSDLRSRALLLMNAEDKDQNNAKCIRKEQLEKFVHSVDEALEIATLCLQLKQAGHFSFARYEEICRRENMKKLKQHLQCQYEEWKSEIQSCRLKYYYLNFLYADQLYQLYYFLREDKRNDIVVTAILKF